LLWLLFGVFASVVEIAVLLFILLPSSSPEHDDHSHSAPLAAASSGEETAPEDEADAAVSVARLLNMVDCRWQHDLAPAAGEVAEGTDLRLESGFAELRFNSGARVVLQGPVWLTPTAENAGQLHQGKLTARVPVPAQGFTIDTPTGQVVDLGTEFGLHVLPSGETVVSVFFGKVEARPSTPGTDVVSSSLLVAGQTAHMTREVQLVGPAEVGQPSAEGEFVRWMPEQGRFRLFATGRGLEQGTLDPHWQIAHESNPTEFKTASIINPNPLWMPNDHYSSQWISLADGEASLPAGRHIFRTRFSLSGYETSHARIIGRWMADNSVEEIRLNGQVVSNGPAVSGFGEFKQFEITTGFAPDENTVEFIVGNDGDGGSPMGFRVEWYGLAEAIEQDKFESKNEVPLNRN
jgi:hypothetical protein